MNEFVPQWIVQTLEQSPVLLVYLVGMVLALAFWRRSPSAALLVLLGAGLLLVTSVLGTFAFHYVIRSRNEMQLEGRSFEAALMALRILTNLARALGTALLVAAAFVGRRGAMDTGAYNPSSMKPEKV